MAAIPTYRTWVAGEVVTADEMNTNIRDAGNFWLARPLAVLYQGSGQSTSHATWTNILFDAEVIDRDGGHSLVTNTERYTSPTAGYLVIAGGVSFVNNVAGIRGAASALNGTRTYSSVLSNPINGAPSGVPCKTFVVAVNGATDWLTIQGYQSSGGALNTDVSPGYQSCMVVYWVCDL